MEHHYTHKYTNIVISRKYCCLEERKNYIVQNFIIYPSLMLLIIGIVLMILRLLGLTFFRAIGRIIHFLLIAAIIMIVTAFVMK